VLPLIKGYYNNVYGVFDNLRNNINEDSVIIGSKITIDLIKLEYKNYCIDGSLLINCIQNNLEYSQIINDINNQIVKYDNIILACTHFLKIKDNSFIIKEIKNK
jgi:hypothetical protein